MPKGPEEKAHDADESPFVVQGASGERAQRVAVLASGTGSILEALLHAGIEICAVITDRPCRAEEVANSAGLEVLRVERKDFGKGFDRDAYSAKVAHALRACDPDLVAMAGFATVLTAPVHDAFPGCILNTHPSLLPLFKGWHAVADALAARALVTGCTVHVATLEVDEGPILAQEEVAVIDGDTVETLHARIKAVERVLYPDTIKSVLGQMRDGTWPGQRTGGTT